MGADLGNISIGNGQTAAVRHLAAEQVGRFAAGVDRIG
jgi:hypothetical protein